MKLKSLLWILYFGAAAKSHAQQTLQQFTPVENASIVVTDPFWKGRMQKVATSTLQACIDYTENKTGRIRNFEKAAKRSGKHEGIYYDDSDVYKALEAMAFSLHNFPDALIEKKADEWIDKIAAAQLPDGYLNTYYTLTGLNNRWTDMEKHEDYCAGHLIEAAIAYDRTTGKSKLLQVAIRMANHIDSTFRLSNRHWVSGHQEIELALMKLYHYTHQERYLQLAQWYLDQRGHGYGKGVIWDEWKDPDYCQDKLPVKEQTQITGHAVRAMYMYTGAADVAAATKDSGYVQAMKTIWEDVVGRNMYITGGIGAQGKNEGFGDDFDLPNASAYCETCASVGMVFWNQRMNMLTGDAKYTDVLERSLYNGALDGLSLSGDRFFYGNPLASTGADKRREWFGTACCPSNIARLVASLGNYIYSVSADKVWINLYIASRATIPLSRGSIGFTMESGYPWNGRTAITVSEAPAQPVDLKFRIPGWLVKPVPEGLYRYRDSTLASVQFSVNGKPVAARQQQGYATISRVWQKGDRVTFTIPMEVREILSRPEVRQDSDRVAIQYGPMVYCVEDADKKGHAYNLLMADKPAFKVRYESKLLGGVNTISFDANVMAVSPDKHSVHTAAKRITAVPYFSWNNRGPGEMQVWLPTRVNNVRINL